MTEVRGDFFPSVAGLHQGSTHGGAFKDTGNPGQQTIGPDQINPRPFATSCPEQTSPTPSSFGWHDVLNGNVTIQPK